MTLLEECIERLGENCEVLDEKQSRIQFDHFQNLFPFAKWGRIDWNRVERKVVISNRNDISRNFAGEECFILWDEGSLPVIKSNINKVLEVLVDVIAVSFDTWIVNLQNKCVIEFYHESEVTIGFNT